jgi:hypothetical protein
MMSEAANTTAAELHGKSDNAGAATHAAKGLNASEGAHKASVAANDISAKVAAKH